MGIKKLRYKYSNIKNILSIIFSILFLCCPLLSQASDDMQSDVSSKKSYGKIDSIVGKLIDKYNVKGLTEASQFAAEQGVKLENGKVKVILVVDENTLIDEQGLASYGVDIDRKAKNLIRAFIPVNRLKSIEKDFPDILRIRQPFTPLELTTSEGVALTNAENWQNMCFTGKGVKVAIIDLGFGNLTATIANGDLPSTVVTNDYSGTGLETGTVHGTAVAEAVHDMAPDAELYLLKIADEVDLYDAVNDCKTLYGINVINHSVGWVNTGPYNGTGMICDIANDADANGIVWVNAAGNEAQKHSEDIFADSDADGWHEFKTSPIDEVNWMSASAGQDIYVFLSWDDWCPDPNNPASTQDYDLYLVDTAMNVVSSSENWQNGTAGATPTESIGYTAPTTGSYGVLVKNYSTTRACDLKIYSFNQNLESGNRTAVGSLMAPADAEGVLTAGAIDSTKWTTGPQESFSSQGPTTNWCSAAPMIKPDIAGPDDVDSFTYGHWYGTSASSPHVAGAAALVFEKYPSYTSADVKNYLEINAIDMGSAGKDNIYGAGRLNLAAIAYQDADNDGTVDSCDTCTDTDNDGYGNAGYFANTCPTDNCPNIYNTDQTDSDNDGIGDACDSCTDTDGDGFGNPGYLANTCLLDNCPDIYNPDQADANNDGIGDACSQTDLIVSALSATVTCSGITINSTTKNNGSGNAGPSTTGFYLSTNSKLDAGDTLFASRAVPAINAGLSSAGSITATLPSGTAAGSYYIIAKADDLNAIAETIETNNTKYTTKPLKPDLSISSLTGPASSGAGLSVSINDTTKNGGIIGSGSSTTGFYLSLNSTLDAGDTLLGSRPVSVLAPCELNTGSTTLTIPSDTPSGKYYIIAKADNSVSVAESSETNNVKSKAINIGPDLVVSYIYGPSSATAGAAILFKDTTKNSGGGDASSSITRFYISANTTLDTGDTEIGSRTVPALAPAGQSGIVSTSVTIPTGISGSYYIIAKADADSAISEMNEANNTKYRAITINP